MAAARTRPGPEVPEPSSPRFLGASASATSAPQSCAEAGSSPAPGPELRPAVPSLGPRDEASHGGSAERPGSEAGKDSPPLAASDARGSAAGREPADGELAEVRSLSALVPQVQTYIRQAAERSFQRQLEPTSPRRVGSPPPLRPRTGSTSPPRGFMRSAAASSLSWSMEELPRQAHAAEEAWCPSPGGASPSEDSHAGCRRSASGVISGQPCVMRLRRSVEAPSPPLLTFSGLSLQEKGLPAHAPQMSSERVRSPGSRQQGRVSSPGPAPGVRVGGAGSPATSSRALRPAAQALLETRRASRGRAPEQGEGRGENSPRQLASSPAASQKGEEDAPASSPKAAASQPRLVLSPQEGFVEASEAMGRSVDFGGHGSKKDLTPDRGWRASAAGGGGGKSYTPERSWRASCGSKVYTPERNWRGSCAAAPGSKAGTPERGWRHSYGAGAGAGGQAKAVTPERSWRASCSGSSKAYTPERSWRASCGGAGGKSTTPRPSWKTACYGVQGGGASPSSPSAAIPGSPPANREDPAIASLQAKGFLSTLPLPWPDDPAGVADDLVHVRGLFSAQVPDAAVFGVYRVENPGLGLVYGAVRGTMEVKDERNLWHGTSADCIHNIALNGFNRAYCGRHGMKLGQGTYFSAAADYSVRFCGRRCPSRVMFLAKVLVGAWTKGHPDLKEPPHRDEEGMARFDSVVNDVESPGIFCVFRDFQAIPLYLVEFSGAVAR